MQLNGINYCDYCFAQKENTGACPKCGLSPEKYNLEVGLLAPGTNLNGKYIIGRALGRGGFGATYVAYSAALNKVVAVKEYLPMNISYRGKGEEEVSVVSDEKRATFEAGKQRFVEEAQMIRRFNSKDNIVTVYEYFYANNTAYYAMEYLEGVDLRKYIVSCGGKLSEDVVIKVMRDVCNALVWVHSTMNVHRDIAPDNIFVCQNGEIKLIDFGAARAVVTGSQVNYSVVLKQGFAPPEQYLTNGEQGPWTDVYAVGATAYYALAGTMPVQALDRMNNSVLTFKGYQGKNVRLLQIISKCMETDKKRRYQNALEVLDALDALGKPQPPEPEPVEPPKTEPVEPPPPTPNKPSIFSNKLVWIIAGLVCVFVVLVMVMVGFLTGLDDGDDSIKTTTTTTTDDSDNKEEVVKVVESSYEVYKSDVTWWEAVSDAERHGGQLVSINSEEEFRQICALAEKEDLVAFWAGICKTSSNDWNDSQWLDGTGFEYQNWLKNEPSGTDENGVAENYLLVFKVQGEWYYNDATHDVSSVYAGKMGYIVEIKQDAQKKETQKEKIPGFFDEVDHGANKMNLTELFSKISPEQTLEFTAQTNLDLYCDEACLSRGVYKPWSLYNGVVGEGTLCNIDQILPACIRVCFDSPAGIQIGFVKTEALFADMDVERYIQNAEADVDVYYSTKNSCIEEGDDVWLVHTAKQIEGFQAVIYEAEKRTRGYKLGYILTEDIMLL